MASVWHRLQEEEDKPTPVAEELQRKKRDTIQAVLDIFDGRLLT